MISIILVSYNSRGYLRNCLEKLGPQVQAQRGEVIVVDNASTDGSTAMVREEFPDCRLLSLAANVGFGAANNRGAQLAAGKYLLLLNVDAWLAPGCLAHLAWVLDTDLRLGLVVPRLRYPDGRLQFAWAPETGVVGETIQKLRNPFETRRWNHRQLPAVLRMVLGPGWHTAACMMVRRSAFDEIGGFDEKMFLYFEDVDLSRRMRLSGWKMQMVWGAQAFHVKGGSQRGDRAELEYRRGQRYYYRKHRPEWENRLLRWRMRRKFARVANPELRCELLKLLD